MSNKTETQLQQDLLNVVQEVGELLKKSGLAKADEDEVGEAAPEHSEPDADNMGGPSDQDADNMPPAEAPAEDAVPPANEQSEEVPTEEGMESGEQDESAEMAAHASELSDEELQKMLEVLMAEVEKRHAASNPEAAPEAAQAQPEQLAASMKSEFASLAKSVADIADAVKSITGEVGSLKKSMSEKKQQVIVARPAATNQNVQVLQKSAEVKEKLNKSDTLQFLLSEQRNGNKRVNSDLIATVSACKSQEDLNTAHKNIEKMGINIPSV